MIFNLMRNNCKRIQVFENMFMRFGCMYVHKRKLIEVSCHEGNEKISYKCKCILKLDYIFIHRQQKQQSNECNTTFHEYEIGPRYGFSKKRCYFEQPAIPVDVPYEAVIF